MMSASSYIMDPFQFLFHFTLARLCAAYYSAAQKGLRCDQEGYDSQLCLNDALHIAVSDTTDQGPEVMEVSKSDKWHWFGGGTLDLEEEH